MAYQQYYSNAMNLFTKPMKEKGFISGFDHVIQATDLTTDSIEFKLDSDDAHYIKTDQTRLVGDFKVVTNEGKAHRRG